ncbi:MAG: zinc-ribbon domain-containing protein [Candidatus Helarchaeota archaeon]
MEDQPVSAGGLSSEWCCVILAVMIMVLEYYTFGEISIWSFYIVIIVFFFVVVSIYNRYSIRRRVHSHLLKFSNCRVPIQSIMTDLQLGFYDVMYILEDIQNKKKLPIEIVERSGEVVIGEIKGKGTITRASKTDVPQKPHTVAKPPPEEKAVVKKRYRCTNCGREMEEPYKYCPGCGRPLKKVE